MPTRALAIIAALALAGCGSMFASKAPATAAAPDLPASITPPEHEKMLLRVNATGVQVYECATGRTGIPEWAFKAPEANLLDAQGKVVGTHGAGPFWQLTDGSRVMGQVVGTADAADPGTIPLLLLKARAPGGTGKLEYVKSIQRLDTKGGKAPKDACTLGTPLRVPYTATYVFWGGDPPALSNK